MSDATFEDYARRGFALMPLRADQKTPYDGAWNLPDYDVDTEKTFFTWDGQRNRLNVGILTRRSGIFVLDVDTAREGHLADGPASLERLTAQYGPLPDTFTVRTRAGGLHYYFKDVPGLRKDNRGKIGQGIDIQAGNAYVVAPPSWVEADEKGPAGAYTVEKDLEVADAPGWLIALAMAQDAQEPRERPQAVQGQPGDFSDSYVAHAVAGEVENILSAQERGASRNDALNTAGFVLGTLLGTGAGDPQEVGSALMDAALTAGLPLSEATYTLERSIRQGMQHPRTAPEGPDVEIALPEPAVGEDGSQEAGPVSTWSALDLEAFLDDDGEDEKPTLCVLPSGKALFYEAAINGVAGEPAAGKSWVAFIAAAQEMRLGYPVVFIDLEDTPRRTVKRLYAVGASRDEVARLFRYVRPETGYNQISRDALDGVTDGARLVVIDSTGEALSLQGAKSNADEDVTAWFTALPKHLAKQGLCVLLLDHVAKAEGGRWPIGSQRKLAAISGAQYTLALGKAFSKDESGWSELLVSKDRHGTYYQDEKPAVLEVAAFHGGVSSFALIDHDDRVKPGDVVIAKVAKRDRVLIAMRKIDAPATTDQVATEVGFDRSDVSRELNALLRDGLVTSTSGRPKFWSVVAD